MSKIKMTANVIKQEMIAHDIHSLWIQAEEIAAQARAGQFLSVYTKDASKLLPRPISICEIDREAGALRLVYRIAGGGTREFAGYRAGGTVTVLGPLGNGFPEIAADRHAFLIGGGIGIPPMLELAKELSCEKTAVLGYRDAQLFLKEEFESYAKVVVATEDGSVGAKGNVLDAIREQGLLDGCAQGQFSAADSIETSRLLSGTAGASKSAEDTFETNQKSAGDPQSAAPVILACGPTPMLRTLKAFAAEHRIECWLSLEERMACGVGACLACVCQTGQVDAHSNVHNKRICKDGPVFEAGEVEL